MTLFLLDSGETSVVDAIHLQQSITDFHGAALGVGELILEILTIDLGGDIGFHVTIVGHTAIL